VTILKQQIPECNIDTCCTTLNGNECVARGAALMCAMLSPECKVRKFQVEDVNYWPVLMSYTPASSLSSSTRSRNDSKNSYYGYKYNPRHVVFPRYIPYPHTTKLTIDRIEPLRIAFEHPKDEVNSSGQKSSQIKYPIHCNLTIGEFQVSMLELSPNAVKEPQIVLKLSLNRHGVLETPQAQLVEFVKRKEENQPELIDENMLFNTPPKEPVDRKKRTTKRKIDENENDEDEEVIDKSQVSDTEATEATYASQKIKKIVRYLSVTGKFDSEITNQKMKEWMSLETRLAIMDQVVKETNERRNELETYIYNMRNKLDGTDQNFIHESDREMFLMHLDDVEQWLYGEGQNANGTAYIDKLQEFKKYGPSLLK